MVCSFRVLSLCRWLSDKLSTGLLQRHIKCPEAHFEKIIVFSLFVFFSALEQCFFLEFWQKISGRLMKTVFHVYRGKFAGNCFSYLKSFFFYFCFRIWEKKFWELWQKLMAGSSNLFFQLSRENICRKFFTKLFWVFEKSSEIDQKFPWNFATWQKTSANLAKLHVTWPEEVFEAVFFGKKCFLTLFGFWGAM